MGLRLEVSTVVLGSLVAVIGLMFFLVAERARGQPKPLLIVVEQFVRRMIE